MSLISVQNFLAPFKNPTHAITLILVAGLFGAYRYSGGSITSSTRVNGVPSKSHVTPIEEDIDEEVITSDEIALENEKSAPTVRKSTTKRGVLDELIGRGKSPKEAPAEATGNGLDDIEKSLGLR